MQTSVGNEQCIVDILQALLLRDAACQLKSCYLLHLTALVTSSTTNPDTNGSHVITVDRQL